MVFKSNICHVFSVAFTEAKYFQQKKAKMIQIVSPASKNLLVIDRKNGIGYKPDIHHFALVLISQKKRESIQTASPPYCSAKSSAVFFAKALQHNSLFRGQVFISFLFPFQNQEEKIVASFVLETKKNSENDVG